MVAMSLFYFRWVEINRKSCPLNDTFKGLKFSALEKVFFKINLVSLLFRFWLGFIFGP